jgi:hypothetical protein
MTPSPARFPSYICSLKFMLLLMLPVGVPAADVVPDTNLVVATRTSTPPHIDGELREACWQHGVPVTRFVQANPLEFAAPTLPTEVIVLFDDRALYIGARMPDPAPDSIVARLQRRDTDAESDVFMVFLDPYHDHRSGSYFGLNAAGTRYDGIRYNDTWSDNSWDGVWESAAHRDSLGWTAELRIPFSQLRFKRQSPNVWGINLERYISRYKEEDYLVFTPKNGNGFVSRFWHLVGLDSITPPHYFELLPYARAKQRFRAVDAGDPFNKKAESSATGGVDFKMGIGPNLVLNATANPDFGQVEVDPAVVNLTDVETYYQEKRPFFIEGSNNLDFGTGGVTDYWSFNWSGITYFYSRRIGRTPQSIPDNDYADVPEGAHIAGAAKLTGKVLNNWNIGSLHAYTIKEQARIEYNGERSTVEVEPATYYTVTRAQKEINGGAQGIGGVFTAAHRFFDDERLKADINGDAFTGGIDGWTFLDKNKTYALAGWSGFSHVRGTPERMIALQRSSRHYFQRPDASYLSVDSNATSLSGWAGRMTLNKEKGNFVLNSSVGTISPGYDVNDLGFMYRADLINAHIGTGYQWTKNTSWTRYANWLISAFGSFDYGGDNTWSGVWTSCRFNFTNYYSGQFSVAVNPQSVNANSTRGGPRRFNRAGWELNTYFYSDSRQPWVYGSGLYSYISAPDDWYRSYWVSAEWKPAGNVNLTFVPQIAWTRDWAAWVDSFEDPLAVRTFGSRYVYAELKQVELSASLRANWTFTPKLSLQLYAQPLFSSGDYDHFKELARPKSNEFRRYPDADVQLESGTYTIDPDGSGPAASFAFDQPDFAYTSVRGNVILRWEYHPGSTLFFVWTHGQENSESAATFDWPRSFHRLFHKNDDNIFLLKMTYWLSG